MRRHSRASVLSSLLVGIFGFAPLVHGATYYVAPAGGDGNAGTQASPWATIQRAADVMVPGDTVIVSPGVYVESVDIQRSGTAEAYITYQAMPGAVMESPDPSQSLEALDVWPGVSYIRLVGFELRGGFHETIYLRPGSHHIEVLDCHIHHNRVGVRWYGSSYGLMERCQIHDNRGGVGFRSGAHDIMVRDTDSYNNNDGADCSGDADGFSADDTTYNITLEGSRAFGNSEDGFDLKAHNALIDRSVSHDNNCVGVKLWNTATLQNSLVYGNGTGVKAASLVSGQGTVFRLINNTVADNTSGIRVSGNQDRLELFNNILSATDRILDFLDCVTVIEDFNLFYRPNAIGDHIVKRLGCNSTGNVIHFSGADINSGAWFGYSGQGAHSRAADPRYADPDAGDYRPGPSSPAIDTASPALAPVVDLEETARPQGNGPDIGAYEVTAQDAVRLSVTSAGTGAGRVMSIPPGVDCGTDCSETFASGTQVTLTATPVGGSSFVGWSGGGCRSTGSCTVTLTDDTAVTATFTASVKDLAIVSLGVSPGSVTAGSSVTVSYSVKNQGTTQVTETYTERIYLSLNSTLETSGDTLLATTPGHRSALGANATFAYSQPITIPAGTVPGNHYILVQADAFGTVAEVNKGNNVSAIAIAITGVAPPPPTSASGTVIGLSGIDVGESAGISGDIASNSTVKIGKGAKISGDVSSNAVSLSDLARITGNVRATTISLENSATITGAQSHEITLPIVGPLPPVQSAPGVEKVIVSKQGVIQLQPGSFFSIEAGEFAEIRLTGGQYDVSELRVGKATRLIFEGATTINVANRLDVGEDVVLSGTGSLTAGDVRVNYAGSADAVFGKRMQGALTVVAPNALIQLGEAGVYSGRFWGQRIRAGKAVQIRAGD